jgi:FkbM family methyltransferase
LEAAAVSNKSGTSVFYEDNISGQNNSLLSEFQTAEDVAKVQYEKLERKKRVVETITVDEYVEKNKISVDFIKIDIEGYELQALEGMENTLKKVSRMMIEVSMNQKKISDILRNNNFRMSVENGKVLDEIPDSFSGNIFLIRD